VGEQKAQHPVRVAGIMPGGANAGETRPGAERPQGSGELRTHFPHRTGCVYEVEAILARLGS